MGPDGITWAPVCLCVNQAQSCKAGTCCWPSICSLLLPSICFVTQLGVQTCNTVTACYIVNISEHSGGSEVAQPLGMWDSSGDGFMPLN